MFDQYLERFPASILDVGCGTGRDLAGLSGECRNCVGVEALPEMIEYAKSRHPHINFRLGDMRTFRLERSFDAILCMGSAFLYALTNAEIDQTLETFVAHARPGTLLILDINNAAACLPGGRFHQECESEFALAEFTARSRSVYAFDRRRQLLIRTRTWTIPGRPPVEDFCEYRMCFPAEMEHFLQAKRFKVVGMFDNMGLCESDLSGARLYIASQFDG